LNLRLGLFPLPSILLLLAILLSIFSSSRLQSLISDAQGQQAEVHNCPEGQVLWTHGANSGKCVPYYCGENGDHDHDGNCIPCSSGTWYENGGSCTSCDSNNKMIDYSFVSGANLLSVSSDAGTPDAGCKPNAGTQTVSKCQKPDAGTPTTMTTSEKGVKYLEGLEGYAGMLKETCSDTVIKSCKMDNKKYGFYDDISGYCTVGYGHLVDKKDKLGCAAIDKLKPEDSKRKEKDGLNPIASDDDAKAVDQLKNDLKYYEDLVNKNVEVQLTQEQFDALVFLAFNVEAGVDKSKSTLMKDINSGKCDDETIKKDFGMWNKTGGKVDQGLINRREKEAKTFNTGEYP